MTKSVNALTSRQVCFILIAYGAATKLILYPAATAAYVFRDIIFPAVINFFLQAVIIWAVSYLSSRTDKTLFELLALSFGKVAARVIMGFFAAYFLFAAIVPISEQQLFIHSAFYDTVPSLYVFLPFYFFAAYAGAKGLKNAGRCADICLPVFLVCMTGIFIMSLGSADFTNLLPILKQPAKNIFSCSLSSLFRFDEAAFMLIFLGHFRYKKGDAAKFTLSYAAGAAIVVAVLATFYAVYGEMSPSRPFMLKDIAAFFPAVNYVGRVDLILIFFLDMVILFAVALRVQACVYCLAKCFNYDNYPLYSAAACAVLAAFTFIFNGKYASVQSAAASAFYIPVIVFAYAAPLACWGLKRR